MAEETELYRHFAANGQLLYIGISLSTVERLSKHRTDAKWFSSIAFIKIERFPTREEAAAAEEAAIQAEKPIWNIIHAKRLDEETLRTALKLLENRRNQQRKYQRLRRGKAKPPETKHLNGKAALQGSLFSLLPLSTPPASAPCR